MSQGNIDRFPNRNFRNDALDCLIRDIRWWQDKREYFDKKNMEAWDSKDWFAGLKARYWAFQMAHARRIERKLIEMYNELAEAQDI